MNELSKRYKPKEIEKEIYQAWEKSGFFNPDSLPLVQRNKAKKFVAVMAPPNITGNLHMGHALENTLIDILVRKKRMEGFLTLWVPGTDHAGIATQNVVEKALKKEGKTKEDLGREKFVERIWKWREQYGNIILNQLKQLGISADWSRLRFTLDKDYQEAVKTAFVNYYKKGWIYRGRRLINWCPRCGTALSDLEVEYEEERGKLYYIRYPLKTQISTDKNTNQHKYIVVATTRPETMLGDTAIAVSPRDKRYKNLVGKKVIVPLIEREITIVADKSVDPNFGTGAVKVTPAHSLTDFEISERHHLPIVQVINEKGVMTEKAGRDFVGLTVKEAREKIVERLNILGLIEKEEDYFHRVAKCYRCHTPIEPLISSQWFLKMKNLADLARKAVKTKQVKIYPQKWQKPYFAWLDNLHDWCVSRQIWWGHRLPVFYCREKQENIKDKKEEPENNEDKFIVSKEKPKRCPSCDGCEIKQTEDVLDTWFSSALWPFTILGWPQQCRGSKKIPCRNREGDLAEFYPVSIMTSAPEILYLWITRMIFSGVEFMGEAPFKTVYIHPVVLTKEGRRMSKSLGTGIDPLELIKKYGADATRFGLMWSIGTNQAIRFNEANIVMGQKFANKIWNASRFILLDKLPLINITQIDRLMQNQDQDKDLTRADKKIIRALKNIIATVNQDIDSYSFGHAAQSLYAFFWHDFCDAYLEESKSQMQKDQKTKERTQKILLFVLLTSLKLLHPFMPFITEEIYQRLPLENKEKFLMIEKWPRVS